MSMGLTSRGVRKINKLNERMDQTVTLTCCGETVTGTLDGVSFDPDMGIRARIDDNDYWLNGIAIFKFADREIII